MENEAAQILAMLRERLDSNDRKRASVQQDIASKISSIEERINELRENLLLSLEVALRDEEERLLKAVTELSALESVPTSDSTLTRVSIVNACKELGSLKNPVVTKLPSGNLGELLSLRFTLNTERIESEFYDKNIELAVQALIDKINLVIEKKDADRVAAQEEINDYSDGFLFELKDLKERLNADLEPEYVREDGRLQKLVSAISERIRTARSGKEDGVSLVDLLRMGRAGLVAEKEYLVVKNPCRQSLRDIYMLEVTATIPKLREMIPVNVEVKSVDCGKVLVNFEEPFDLDERNTLKSFGIDREIKFKVHMGETEGDKPKSAEWELNRATRHFSPFFLKEETEYSLSMWVEYKGVRSNASMPITFRTPNFSECCAWKECRSTADDGDSEKSYTLLDRSRIAFMNAQEKDLAICGNTFIPLNKVTSWSIRILNSVGNSDESFFIGVTCFDFEEHMETQPENCKWWCINWENSLLYSGPPHYYEGVKYCLTIKSEEEEEEEEYEYDDDNEEDYDYDGEYNIEEDKDIDNESEFDNNNIVGVVMDTTNGNLSFVLNGVNYGIAYEGIPLDKPLIPYVLLRHQGDSVELDLSEVRENMDSSINPPSIKARRVTWDSITLTWDVIEGVPFYQIEVDGLIQKPMTETEFTKRGLLPETEHSFRVRAVNDNSVGEWSSVVKARTAKAQEFSGCIWKECPGDVDPHKAYHVDEENPHIASKHSLYSASTLIGDRPLPHNKTAFWTIEITSSYSCGSYAYVGVAPSDINQNENYENYFKCGWYFHCYHTTLCSGPPHNYREKSYGKLKGKSVRGSVSVAMDTAKGELSFVLVGQNLGVAYEGIPLDKPLVPCVILQGCGVFAELIVQT